MAPARPQDGLMRRIRILTRKRSRPHHPHHPHPRAWPGGCPGQGCTSFLPNRFLPCAARPSSFAPWRCSCAPAFWRCRCWRYWPRGCLGCRQIRAARRRARSCARWRARGCPGTCGPRCGWARWGGGGRVVVLLVLPGRRSVEWLLLLPLAMPAYVTAYAYTDFLQFSGPLQQGLRSSLGLQGRLLPEVRSLGGAVWVFIFSLYPYVYLLARTALGERTAHLMEAARLLGAPLPPPISPLPLPLAPPPPPPPARPPPPPDAPAPPPAPPPPAPHLPRAAPVGTPCGGRWRGPGADGNPGRLWRGQLLRHSDPQHRNI